MLASRTSTTSSVVWQGSTKDGYTLRLTRSALTQISFKLKQTGLEPLVRSLRSNNPGSLESAVVGAIAQVVNQATASGTVSSREFGRNLRSFTATGKTRKYQILTQPIERQQGAILFVRSYPIQEFEYEGEYENGLRRSRSSPARLPNLIPPAPPHPNSIVNSIRYPRVTSNPKAEGSGNAVKTKQNIAFAIVNIGGRRTRIDAISGQSNRGQPYFRATPTGKNNRENDSEIKILDQIAHKYSRWSRLIPEPRVKGSVIIFTERRACSSCLNVFRQFRQKFPNIDLKVQHGNVGEKPSQPPSSPRRPRSKPKRRHSI